MASQVGSRFEASWLGAATEGVGLRYRRRMAAVAISTDQIGGLAVAVIIAIVLVGFLLGLFINAALARIVVALVVVVVGAVVDVVVGVGGRTKGLVSPVSVARLAEAAAPRPVQLCAAFQLWSAVVAGVPVSGWGSPSTMVAGRQVGDVICRPVAVTTSAPLLVSGAVLS